MFSRQKRSPFAAGGASRHPASIMNAEVSDRLGLRVYPRLGRRGKRWRGRPGPRFPRVTVETPAPPALFAHWKGNGCRGISACTISFPELPSARWRLGVSQSPRVVSTTNNGCPFTTNSDAPSPTCGSPSPTAATTSVCIAARETKARSTATFLLPIICAWPAFWSEWGSRKFA